jgi:hypothetical protein
MEIIACQGNTVIFDSFTPEEEVVRRNAHTPSISSRDRFHSRFQIDVNAEGVSAVLCASTVPAYRVIDKKGSSIINPTDKRPVKLRDLGTIPVFVSAPHASTFRDILQTPQSDSVDRQKR